MVNEENYYGKESNIEYMSVSQYKDFAGTYGRVGCEEFALKKALGEEVEQTSTAMLVGSYVDSYFEGTLDDFKFRHPQLFKKDGKLKAEFLRAEGVIRRIEKDEFFMKFLGGEKQVIMTGELFGTKWKIKMDSYIPGVAIVDLKVMASLAQTNWVKDEGQMDFVRYWGYDIQGAVYQEIVRQNTGEKLPFYIAGASKEFEPDIQIIQVTQKYLNDAMERVSGHFPRIAEIKSGLLSPRRCEMCDYCKRTRVLKEPISIEHLGSPF